MIKYAAQRFERAKLMPIASATTPRGATRITSLFFALLMALPMLSGCFMPQAIEDNQNLVSSQLEGNPAVVSHDLPQGEFSLHYRTVGTPEEAVLLWIHGTPGGWSDIAGLMVDTDFTGRARLVSIDRPGWGRSQFVKEPRMAGTFDEHSALLKPLLAQLKAQYPEVPLIVAGHSWGAPMAVVLGADYPGLVDGVLAIAGPFDPELPILRWYNYAGRLPGISWLIGSGLRNSNQEMFLIEDEVDAAQARWQRFERPLLVLHGELDSIVPIAHAGYAEKTFRADTTTVIRLPEQGHLLQFERTALIGRCALALAHGRPGECQER